MSLLLHSFSSILSASIVFVFEYLSALSRPLARGSLTRVNGPLCSSVNTSISETVLLLFSYFIPLTENVSKHEINLKIELLLLLLLLLNSVSLSLQANYTD
jgi:hypothetical protein